MSVNPSNAGTRTMLTNLVPALAALAPHLRLRVLCHPGNRDLYEADDVELEVIDLGSTRRRRVLFDLVGAARIAAERADVLVTPSNVGPLRCAVPQVAVVAAHLVLPSCQIAARPQRMPRSKELYFRTFFRRYLASADRVVAISDYLADGLVEEIGLDAERVLSMNLGVDAPPGGPTVEGRGATTLFVGTLYGYKDGTGAVRAFAAARRDLPPGARLVIVGRDHKGEAARLVALAIELGVADAVEVRGPVDASELDELFRTAGVLLMPSRCEGYGLPVAEAMAHGLPVIAADATSLPGVAGGAAVLVPPGDVSGFASALTEVLGDAGRRREMAERGIARAGELTWDHAALVLRRAIDEVLPARFSPGSATPPSG